jgi:hypothetical protein
MMKCSQFNRLSHCIIRESDGGNVWSCLLATLCGLLVVRVRIQQSPIAIPVILVIGVVLPIALRASLRGKNMSDRWGPLYLGFYVVFVMLFLLVFASRLTITVCCLILIVDTSLGGIAMIFTVTGASALLFQAGAVAWTTVSPVVGGGWRDNAVAEWEESVHNVITDE